MTYLHLTRLWLMRAPAPAIPYRTDAAVSAGSAINALLATGALLALLIGILLYSRRRGWLPRMVRPATPSGATDVRVLASRRVSMATTVHVLEYRGHTYLLTESTRSTSASLTPLPLAPAGPEDGVA